MAVVSPQLLLLGRGALYRSLSIHYRPSFRLLKLKLAAASLGNKLGDYPYSSKKRSMYAHRPTEFRTLGAEL